MRIAVLADIHGNHLALEAVLEDVERMGGCDRLVNLGDCVSGPLWPAETMATLASLECLTVRGNHDRRVGLLEREALSGSDLFAWDALAPEQRQWLASLPFQTDVAPGVLAFHGSPRSDEEYLIETVDEGRLARDRRSAILERLGTVEAEMILCGHSHRPDLLAIAPRLILNPGSVGCPAYTDDQAPRHVSESGSPLARYAAFEIEDDTHAVRSVTLRAVSYDVERAARQAERNDRADWALALRYGFVTSP